VQHWTGQVRAGNGEEFGTGTSDGQLRDLRHSIRLVASSRYLQAIAATICISSFVTTLTGWQFKAIAKQWFIDTVIWRMGDGLAGLTVLIFATFLHLPVRQISCVALLLISAWLVAVWVARRQYVVTLEENISRHRSDVEQASTLALDRSTSDLLATKILTSDPKEILYALRLLEVERRRTPHPAVRGLLKHPDKGVRQKALSLLDASAETTVLMEVRQLLKDPDLNVRTEALLYLTHHAHVDPLTLIEELGNFAEFSVRSSMVGIWRGLGKLRIWKRRAWFVRRNRRVNTPALRPRS
jgi:hypothetical protein